MKTKLFLLLGMCTLLSCTNDLDNQPVTEDVTSVVVTAKDFQLDKQTRTNFEITNEGAAFKWAANDTIGIFPDQGFQGYFPMTSGAGTNTASFTGGGWALKSASNYSAYYPMQGKFYLDKTAIPVSYEGQTQTGNASTTHLGKYDFMAAVAKTPVKGKVTFDFEHLGALVELNVTLPKAGTYTSVILHCDEAVFPSLKGTVDITSANPEIGAMGEKSKKLKINLKDFVTTKENEAVKVYFMTVPVDLTRKEITVWVQSLSVGTYYGSVNIGDLLAGFAYSLNVADVTEPPYDPILWVDLGLPSGILWATMNVGATSPEDYGDYFAWGEVKTKDSYDESNSLTSKKPMSDISGNPRYDAATANWGVPARMPKDSEISELVNNCTTTWTTQSGVNGRLVTGPNGNSIFLPAAGGWFGTSLDYVGEFGLCWGSTPYEDYDDYAYGLYFNSSGFNSYWYPRDRGFSVRPVRD